MLRFFQENKTEVFEINCDGNTFEMFESMRVYIERNGRSYNYLPSVRVLNVKREEELIKEEKDAKAEKAEAEAQWAAKAAMTDAEIAKRIEEEQAEMDAKQVWINGIGRG